MKIRLSELRGLIRECYEEVIEDLYEQDNSFESQLRGIIYETIEEILTEEDDEKEDDEEDDEEEELDEAPAFVGKAVGGVKKVGSSINKGLRNNKAKALKTARKNRDAAQNVANYHPNQYMRSYAGGTASGLNTRAKIIKKTGTVGSLGYRAATNPGVQTAAVGGVGYSAIKKRRNRNKNR